MFNILADEQKVQRKGEKMKIREQEKKAKAEQERQEMHSTLNGNGSAKEEVKMSWADVSDDEEQPVSPVHDDTSSDEGDAHDDEEEQEQEEEDEVAEARSAMAGSDEPDPKTAAPKQLSKKEKAALKKQELDDLDDVLAEFGVDVATENEPAGESKRSKKKKKTEEAPTAGGEAGTPEPRTTEPEPSDALDEEAKAEALKKIAAKGKGKGKGGAKADAKKSGISSAAEEAKKRAKNAAKPKKDKNAFDR